MYCLHDLTSRLDALSHLEKKLGTFGYRRFELHSEFIGYLVKSNYTKKPYANVSFDKQKSTIYFFGQVNLTYIFCIDMQIFVYFFSDGIIHFPQSMRTFYSLRHL